MNETLLYLGKPGWVLKDSEGSRYYGYDEYFQKASTPKNWRRTIFQGIRYMRSAGQSDDGRKISDWQVRTQKNQNYLLYDLPSDGKRHPVPKNDADSGMPVKAMTAGQILEKQYQIDGDRAARLYVRMAMDNVMKELGYNVYGGVIVGTDEEGKPDGVTSRDYSLTDNGILRVTQFHDGQIQGEMFFTGNNDSETERRTFAGTQKTACAKRADIRKRLFEEYGLVLNTTERIGPDEVMPKSIEEIDEDHDASDIQNANEMAMNEARKAGQMQTQMLKEQAMD